MKTNISKMALMLLPSLINQVLRSAVNVRLSNEIQVYDMQLVYSHLIFHFAKPSCYKEIWHFIFKSSTSTESLPHNSRNQELKFLWLTFKMQQMSSQVLDWFDCQNNKHSKYMSVYGIVLATQIKSMAKYISKMNSDIQVHEKRALPSPFSFFQCD